MNDLPSTIKYPGAFKSSLPAGYNGIFDWSFLLPVFEGTKIEPTDIDGMVERHGKVLFMETKGPSVPIPQGQIIAYKTLLTIGKGKIYLMIFYGKTSSTIEGMDEWYYRHGVIKQKGYQGCDWNYVFERVKAWFNWANKEPI